MFWTFHGKVFLLNRLQNNIKNPILLKKKKVRFHVIFVKWELLVFPHRKKVVSYKHSWWWNHLMNHATQNLLRQYLQLVSHLQIQHHILPSTFWRVWDMYCPPHVLTPWLHLEQTREYWVLGTPSPDILCRDWRLLCRDTPTGWNSKLQFLLLPINWDTKSWLSRGLKFHIIFFCSSVKNSVNSIQTLCNCRRLLVCTSHKVNGLQRLSDWFSSQTNLGLFTVSECSQPFHCHSSAHCSIANLKIPLLPCFV